LTLSSEKSILSEDLELTPEQFNVYALHVFVGLCRHTKFVEFLHENFFIETHLDDNSNIVKIEVKEATEEEAKLSKQAFQEELQKRS